MSGVDFLSARKVKCETTPESISAQINRRSKDALVAGNADSSDFSCGPAPDLMRGEICERKLLQRHKAIDQVIREVFARCSSWRADENEVSDWSRLDGLEQQRASERPLYSQLCQVATVTERKIQGAIVRRIPERWVDLLWNLLFGLVTMMIDIGTRTPPIPRAWPPRLSLRASRVRVGPTWTSTSANDAPA